MKAIVINSYGGPDMLEAAKMPTPMLRPGDVLVRVMAAGVNPADHKWRAGLFSSVAPVSFPHILGYDVAGVVIAGDGFAPGTRMFAMLDPIRKGGYAEQVAAPATLLAAIPDALDFPTAAAIPTAGLTGLQMVERGIDARSGQTILVTGAVGAVGRFILYAAKARGARVVAAVRAAQGATALALGADAIVKLGEEDWTGVAFDHVLDTVGGEAAAHLSRHLKQGGRILTAATDPIPVEGLPVAPEFFAVVPDGADLARLGAAVSAGEIAVPIARILPLDRAAEAQALVERGGQGGKVILAP